MLNAIARPFGQFLMLLYDWVGNYGLSIILFAIAVKFILLPFQMKSKPGMMRQTRLQPKINEIQKKYASNKTKANEEIAKLYKSEGVNPASGCLWSFLPLPIMFALYLVIRQPLTMMMGLPENLLTEGGAIYEKLKDLVFASTIPAGPYEQIHQAKWIGYFFDQFKQLDIQGLRLLDFNFLGIDLGAQPQYDFLWTTDWRDASVWLPNLALFLVPIISGGSQFAATAINRKMMPMSTPEGQGKSMQNMMMLMPLLSVVIAFSTPAALGFYWSIGTILQIAQDVWLTKRYTKKLDAEEAAKNAERKKKEAEIEAKRVDTERKKAEGLLVERNPNTSKRKKQKSDKQEQIDKAAEWEKKNAPDEEAKDNEPSRVENRRYARGRAYDPDRYARSAENGKQEPVGGADADDDDTDGNDAGGVDAYDDDIDDDLDDDIEDGEDTLSGDADDD